MSNTIQLVWKVVCDGWWYLDYRVSSGPFLRFSMRFELLSEILYHSVCEIRDPSLTINLLVLHKDVVEDAVESCIDQVCHGQIENEQVCDSSHFSVF